MATRLLFIHAMTPLHAGTGQAVGGIDLPIARERPTGIPLVPGSSIKGALRARDTSEMATVIFGPPTETASESAGAVQIADAHLILLPVRSLAGTFAWVTSPYLLSRFARDAKAASIAVPVPPSVPDGACLILGDKLLAQLGNDRRRVVLEDLDFLPGPPSAVLDQIARILGQCLFPGSEAADLAARQALVDRLCLIHDDAMSYLLEAATEVVARVRLDEEKKTVAKGALWYEEALPAESILVGLALANHVRRAGTTTHQAEGLLAALERNAGAGLVQLGGKATVGRGLCRIHFPAAALAGAR